MNDRVAAPFQRFLTPPVFPDEEGKTTLAQVLYVYLLSSTILYALAFPAILMFFQEETFALVLISSAIFFTTIMWNLVRRGFVYPVARLSLAYFWIATTVTVYISGGMQSLDWAFYIPGTVAAGLFLGNRGAALYAAASLVVGLVMALLGMNGYPFPRLFPFQHISGWVLLLFNLCVTVMPIIIYTRRLNTALSLARQEVIERRNVEQELLLNRYCVEQASVGIMRTGPEAEILYTNEQYCKMSGYSAEELTQMHIYDIDPDFPLEKWKAHRQSLQASDSSAFETIHKRKDGTLIPVEVRNRYLKFEESGFAVSFISDISERKHAEMERESLIAELEAKNRELEQFTYTVSHDLKAPLITIRGFLNHLEDDISTGDDERAKKDMQRIVQASDRMELLLNDLLELSRIGRIVNPPQAVSFERVVHEALERVAGSLAKRAVQVEIQAGLPEIYGDRTRLVQVMQNLIDNACKFMGDQTAPCIEIGQSGKDANGMPVFFVRDNGIGIDPQHRDSIFGLFNKLDHTVEGTGIGLALVKRIVEVYGGQVWVDSEGLGKGATFYFTLADKR